MNVALTVGNNVGIDKGLSPGDMVVTDGQDKLQDGSKVDQRTHRGQCDSGSAERKRAQVRSKPGAKSKRGGTKSSKRAGGQPNDESIAAVYFAAGRDHAVDGRHSCWRASSPIASCRFPRCRKSIIRRFRC